MTRHWVEANISQGDAGFSLICEHPEACMETEAEARDLGCSVKDWFDDVGIELLDFPKDNTVLFGRVEVATSWRGYGEDGELTLRPMNSPAAASAGSRQPNAAGDPTVDWRRLTMKLVRTGVNFYGLTTAERDAIEAERDREAIAEDARIERSTEAATGLEGRDG